MSIGVRGTRARDANQTTIRLVGTLATTPAITPITIAMDSAVSRRPITSASDTENTIPIANTVQRLFIAACLFCLSGASGSKRGRRLAWPSACGAPPVTAPSPTPSQKWFLITVRLARSRTPAVTDGCSAASMPGCT